MWMKEHSVIRGVVSHYSRALFCRSFLQACRLVLVASSLLVLRQHAAPLLPSLLLQNSSSLLRGVVRQESNVSIRSTTTTSEFFATTARSTNQMQQQSSSRYRKYTNPVAYDSSSRERGAGSSRKTRRRGTRPDGRVLYFLHIHKSGGSSLCQAAQRNGLAVDARHNCNVQPDARCCGNQDSLVAQQQFARTTRFKFVANERDMYDAMDVQSYRYVVTLRNSYSRYQSHYRHVIRDSKNYTASFESWYEGQPDNYAVRMICGTQCSNVSKYQITPELFNYQNIATRIQSATGQQ